MEQVIVNDVAPRDGLQNHPTAVSPEDRVALINRLVEAGVSAVEVASFVSARAVPRMAGAAEVVAQLDLDRAAFSALVPNRKGYELARATGVRSVALVLSATEQMNRNNINMGLDTATAVCREVLQQATADGVEARCYISVAFECPFEGTVPDSEVERLATEMRKAGATEIIVADTIGAGNPARARALFGRMVAAFGADRLAAHLHDTRALALANVWEALASGIRKFDASLGGLGGCPFAPGAAGNLATEDLVSMLHQSGFHTGIDLRALLDTLQLLASLVGTPVGGRALPWLERQFPPIDTELSPQ
ncbi:MAG: hydroxymethylglutaryl-CoA lyase [Gammaproteobacteria bacterium]|nr:hydroxymethylglutaryl-CoA lyase [Gammaproteobacteria bacterium]